MRDRQPTRIRETQEERALDRARSLYLLRTQMTDQASQSLEQSIYDLTYKLNLAA